MNLPCGNKPLKTSACTNCDDRIDTLENNVTEIKEKLKTIEEGAEVNVQADWTEENPESESYIQNKPEIDDEMSDSSSNAVENHVIKEYVDGIGISLDSEQPIVGEAIVDEAVIGELVSLVLEKADGTEDRIGIIGEGAVNVSEDNDILTIEVPEGTAEDLANGTDTDPKAWAANLLHDYIVQQIGDHFLDLAKTKFVPNFEWSLAEYPESTNPHLDGKPVLVLALTDGTVVAYSFLNMEDLIDIYTGVAPISISDGNVIYHDDSGVTAGSYGDSANQTPAFGGTFKALRSTVDSKGHVTAMSEHTVKIPDTLATENTAGLMSADDKLKLDTVDDFYATKCGSIVTVTDAKAGKAKGLDVELTPVQDNQYDSVWIGGVGKNKLPFDQLFQNGWTNTLNGVTATYNNGIMHIEGTHTSTGWSNVVYLTPWTQNPFPFPSGVTIRTPVTQAGATSITMQARVDGVSGNYGNGNTIPAGADVGVVGFYIAVSGQQDYNFDLPMILTTGDTRPTAFEPYENIVPITAPTTSKNLIPYPYLRGDHAVSGITYTDNGDGTLTIDGTATASAFYDLGDTNTNTFELPVGTYTLTGSGNANIGVTLCKVVSGSGQFFKNANVSPVTFTTSETATYYLYVVTNSGTTVNNLTIKPQLEKGSQATQFRPYGENVQVIRTGKNLLDPQYKTYSGQNNVRYYRAGGGGIKLRAGFTYTLSVSESNTRPNGLYFNKYDPLSASHPTYFYKYNAYSVTYTPSEDVVIETDCYYANAPTEGIENIKVQLELGDTATAYEPYAGITTTTNLGRTVYGGTVDVTGGEVTETIASVDLGTLAWVRSSIGYFLSNLAGMKTLKNWRTVSHIKSDRYATTYPDDIAATGATADFAISTNPAGTQIFVADSRYTSAADFKSAMNRVIAVYELATPTTTSITGSDITLNSGTNNVWSDGDVCLTYLKDRGELSDLFADVQNMHTSFQVTLDADEWDETGSQTVDAVGMSPDVDVIISPVPTDIQDYVNAGIVCIAQGVDSLTFHADTPVTVNVNVLIAR